PGHRPARPVTHPQRRGGPARIRAALRRHLRILPPVPAARPRHVLTGEPMRNPLARRRAPTEPGTPASLAATPAAPPARGEPEAGPAGGASFGAYLRYFVGLGTWGFGGPIASVGYMQRDLVERRGWLTEAEFLDGVALGQTMPGPLAAQ